MAAVPACVGRSPELRVLRDCTSYDEPLRTAPVDNVFVVMLAFPLIPIIKYNLIVL